LIDAIPANDGFPCSWKVPNAQSKHKQTQKIAILSAMVLDESNHEED
jgi:hypothetical protein